MPPKRKQTSDSEPTLKAKILSISKEVDQKFVCDADKTCKYSQAQLNAHNFARHIASHHPDVYTLLELGGQTHDEEISIRSPKPPFTGQTKEDYAVVRVSKERVMGGVVKLVTQHSLPFNALTWEGLQDIIGHQLTPFGIKLNNRNITEHVDHVRKAIDNIICEEVHGEMLSVKFDSTTKRYRSVLGINVQFYQNTTLKKRTLGMVELHGKHTAKNLKDKIEEVYGRFGIQSWQIYSSTVDNAPNVVSTVGKMQETQREERNQKIDEHAAELFHQAAEEEDNVELSDEEIVRQIEEFSDMLSDHEMSCVRCGAHTFNLVVTDNTTGIHNKETSQAIVKIVGIVKTFRKAEFKEAFDLNKQRFPPIPNVTRWNAYVILMQVLQKGKAFFDRLAATSPELDLTLLWPFIDDFCEAFNPLCGAIIRVQKLDCPLSQFYFEWLRVRGQITSIPDANRFKVGILESMDKREKKIFDCEAYRAALYMDPRFVYNGSKLFTANERERIIAYLVSIWKKVNGSNNPEVEQPIKNPIIPSSHEFDMDSYITNMFGEGSSKQVLSKNMIEQAIRNIQYQNRHPASDETFNVVEYWFKHKLVDCRLWMIAKVVYTAAATQVSVERDNSHFSLVFTPHRHIIKEDNLENVMQIKLNVELLNHAIKSVYGTTKKQ